MRITDPRIYVFLVYCILFYMSGKPYLEAYRDDKYESDYGFNGELMIWWFGGGLLFLIALGTSLSYTYHWSEEMKKEIDEFSNRNYLKVVLLYAISTYIIVFYITRQTGEQGYWI